MSLSTPILTARRALALIGSQANVESFTENSPEAAFSGLFYDQSLEEVLAEHDWSFARKFQKLAESTKAPTNHWSYRYSLPVDLLVLRGQVNPAGRKANSPPGQIENKDETVTFMTDVESLEIFYTAKLDVSVPYFKQAHTYLLASYLASGFLGDDQKGQNMLQRYQQSLARAKTTDSNQEVPDEPKEATWIRKR